MNVNNRRRRTKYFLAPLSDQAHSHNFLVIVKFIDFNAGPAPSSVGMGASGGCSLHPSEENEVFFALKGRIFCDLADQNSKFFAPVALIGTAGKYFYPNG